MIKQIKDKLMLAAMAMPVYALTDAQQDAEEEAQRIAAEKAAAGGGGPSSTTFSFGPGSDFSGIKNVSVPKIISSGISVLMIAAMVIFFVILVVGGIKWITSGGDEKKVAAARASVTNSLIGLAIVFASWAIMSLLGTLFGVTIFETFSLPTFY